MLEVCCRPHHRLLEDIGLAERGATNLLRREVGFQAVGDRGGWTPMQTLWLETISDKGSGHFGHEGRMQVDHRGSTTLWGMCLLPHLNPALRAHCRATLRLAKEGAEVRVERRELRVGSKIEGNVDGDIGSPESNVQGLSDIRHGRHKPN